MLQRMSAELISLRGVNHPRPPSVRQKGQCGLHYVGRRASPTDIASAAHIGVFIMPTGELSCRHRASLPDTLQQHRYMCMCRHDLSLQSLQWPHHSELLNASTVELAIFTVELAVLTTGQILQPWLSPEFTRSFTWIRMAGFDLKKTFSCCASEPWKYFNRGNHLTDI